MNIPIINANGEYYSNFKYFNRGGMGLLYKGIEIKTNEDVILKLLEIDNNIEELLIREIEASNKLIHNNIVKTRATGKIKIENGIFFYVIQDYYTKGNLRTIIKEGIPLNYCLKMMFDILYGMKEIHKLIIHRDLKPENILISIDDHLLITDFGLAKYINDKTKTKTFKGYGTVPYMSPECWINHENTKYMDVYSLGIIFFEILTGKLPFEAKNDKEWEHFHLYELMPEISKFKIIPEPTKLNQIIRKMTMKKKEERYKTIDEIIKELKKYEEIIYKENIINKADSYIKEINIKVLNKLKEENNNETLQNSLNYNITNLFDQFKVEVNLINNILENEKIKIYEPLNNSNNEKILEISFSKRKININIKGLFLVDHIEKKRYNKLISNQKKSFSVPDSFLNINNIILIGIVELERNIDCEDFGYNLLLSKKENDNYGEWNVLLSQRKTDSKEKYFAIDADDFINSYENAQNNQDHNFIFRKFEKKDIIIILEKLFD